MSEPTTDNHAAAKAAIRQILAGIRVEVTDNLITYTDIIEPLNQALANGGAWSALKVYSAFARSSAWLREIVEDEQFYPTETWDADKLFALLQYEFTDFGQAETLAHVYGDKLRHVPGLGWLIWTGKRWQEDTRAAVYQFGLMVARLRLQAATAWMNQAEGKEDQAKTLQAIKWCANARNIAGVRRALDAAATMPQFVVDTYHLDANPMALGVRNGVVDLRAGLVVDASPSLHLTKRTEIDFYAHAPAPRWNQFLLEIFGNNAGLVDYVQRCVGYSLTGDTSEQCFWVLHGMGANGKSTFLEVLRALGGDYAAGTPFNTFLHGQQTAAGDDLARLRGVRVVLASESGEGARLNEERIKAVTGGDEITARHLYGKYFTYKPQFHIWLATNHKPVIYGADTGIWRRVRLIPFNQSFRGQKADKDLLAKLKAELAGVLAWAVEGAQKWQRHGLAMDETVAAATKAYREEMDLIGNWLADCCIAEENAKCAKKEAYRSFSEWCGENGIRPMTQPSFSRALQDRGFYESKSGSIRFWVGFKMIPPTMNL